MVREFLLPASFSFLIAVALLFVLSAIGRRVFPERRSGDAGRTHKPLLRIGGLGAGLAFAIAVAFDPVLEWTPELVALVAGTGLALAFGLVDDIRPVPWPAQLLVQVSLAVLLFFSGMRVWVLTNPFGEPFFLHPELNLWPSLLVGTAFTLLVMNAMNWADGVDGLLGGVSAVAYLAILLVSLRPEVDQPSIGILAATLLGGTAAFLFFNSPPARLLAGTSGSYFFGFTVAALALFSGAKMATVLLALAVPVLDAAFVVRERIRAGESPFVGGDARHLHDRLRQAGWPDRDIALLYTAISAVSAALALFLPTAGKVAYLLALAFILVFFLAALNRLNGKRTI